MSGLPGAYDRYDIAELRTALQAYDGLTHDDLRANLKRLQIEELRDSLLAVSGQLVVEVEEVERVERYGHAIPELLAADAEVDKICGLAQVGPADGILVGDVVDGAQGEGRFCVAAQVDITTEERLLIKKTPVLDSASIIHAQELYGPYEGKLTVKLNKAGANKMFDATKRMTHGVDRLAIILDGKILSAPVVQDSLGAQFEISGMKDAAEAKKIAAALLSPLNHSLKVKSINPPLAK